MDITASPVKALCRKFLKKGIQQQRHLLKLKYFEGRPLHEVPTQSPVYLLSDLQWNELVQHWMHPNMIVSSFHKS